MRHWLTTHWPNPVDRAADAPHYNVWIPDGKVEAANGMDRGDLVFVYETGRGKTTLERYLDGTTKPISRHVGRQGVVGLLRVLDKPSQPLDSKPEVFTDGTKKWWRYIAPTENVNSSGFVPRQKVAEVLNFKPKYVFKGFGIKNSGLGRLTPEQFAELLHLFGTTATLKDKFAREVARRSRGPTGEGPLHQAIKAAVARDPAGLLGEEGLKTWQVEFILPTNDRVDVVLKDTFGRLVAVEIEPQCDTDELVGPMQCMKYRALLAYLFKRPLEEVRAILLSPTIHADVKARCKVYGIQCVVIGDKVCLPAVTT
jgi:hypothetical protein